MGNNNHVIQDQKLKLFRDLTKLWQKDEIKTLTKSRFTPKLEEMHCLAGLFTVEADKYSIRNGFHQQTEIQPPEIYNYIAVESRIGNEEGTGYAVKTEQVEEGNPTHIKLESLGQRLTNLYKKARSESFGSYCSCFSETNRHHAKKHIESLTLLNNRGRKIKLDDVDLDFFYHLEEVKQVSFAQEINSARVPGEGIQNLLAQIDEELRGDNQIGKNGFKTLARVDVINETDRLANSAGSMVRTYFSGYSILYRITFDHPKSGEFPIDWSFGIEYSDIRKYKKFLLDNAKKLNTVYNEFFNSKNNTTIKAGKWPAYLEPENTASHLHEAIVHACSSDYVAQHLKFSDLEDRVESPFKIEDINTQIADKRLSLVCNPKKKIKGNKLPFGGYHFDHELVEPQRFNIIRNGVLTGLIADRNDAYLINSILGQGTIVPGSSRFGKTEEADIDQTEPRTSVLEVKWTEKLTRGQLLNRFLSLIKREGRDFKYQGKKRKAGLWLKGGYDGLFTEDGSSKVSGSLAYLILDDGVAIPVDEMIYTSNSPRTLLSNIIGISRVNPEHITGYCGAGEEGDYYVRESIFTGPCIIRDLEVNKNLEVPTR